MYLVIARLVLRAGCGIWLYQFMIIAYLFTVLVHKDTVNSTIGCRPLSNRLMTVGLRASSFNITIIQVYAPTSVYGDSEVDGFYKEHQSLVDQTPQQDILVVQGDWNAKVGEDSQEDWEELC